ncbi:hypothetical protein FCIRC_2342 [Fusarium circinatum]|uniref:Uncharacterized protein n=1 Tax=Fusarium circinatum TaxID=48490 RepID=A0A8H5UHF5_FUSCI|nr:hypothetical protein FCIRC_2342 [Fusarium circinatum]
MHFPPSHAYHALSGPDPALALHRHLSLKPLGGGSASKACPDQPKLRRVLDALNLTPRQCLGIYLHTIPLTSLTPSFFAVLRASPHSRPCRRRVIHHRLYASRPLIPFSDLPLQPYLALGPSLSSRLVRGHGSSNPADLFLDKKNSEQFS